MKILGKHIEIHFDLIREQVLTMIFELQHLATKEMTSDMLTKTLDPNDSTHLRTNLLGMLDMCDSHCNSRGVLLASQ